MSWQTISWLFPLFSAVLSATLAVCLVRYRDREGANPLILLMCALAFWSLTYAMEYRAAGIDAKYLWARIEYFGVVSVSPLWLIFALSYAGHGQFLSRRNIFLISLIPIITLILVWTNPAHNLMWYTIRLDNHGPFPLLVYERGLWFWLLVAYAYAVLFIGTVLLFRTFVMTRHLYRRQLAIILFGLSAPWLSNALYVAGFTPFKYLDLTPFALTLTGLAMTLAILRFRILINLPIAREAVMDAIRDGILILDKELRIADYNNNAHSILGTWDQDLVGLPIDRHLPNFDLWLKRLENKEVIQEEFEFEKQQGRGWCRVGLSKLKGKKNEDIGYMVIIRDISQQKEAELALRNSEKKFRQLVESIDQIFFNIDGNGVVTYISPGSRRILGVPWAEVIGRHFSDLIHPDDMNRIMEEFSEAMVGYGYPSEYRIIHGEKLYRWVQSQSKPLLEGDQVIGIQGVITDIHERKLAEEALRESEERYRHLFSNAPAGIYEIDLVNLRFTSVNDVMCELTGYTEDEILSMDPADFLTDESRKRFLARLGNITAGDPPSQFNEYQIKTADGQIKWAVLNNRFHFDGDQIVGATVVVHDITERKRAEESIREWELKYRTVIDNATEGILVSRDQAILFANPRVLEIAATSLDEIIGKSMLDYIHEDDQALIVDRYIRIRNGEKMANFTEFRLIDRNGTNHWVLGHSVLIDWEGETALLTFLTETTEQKRAEEEKVRLQTQLQQSQKMEAVGTLASGIAHDFNNLLQGISGYLELMSRDKTASETAERYASAMHTTVQRGADLVNRLLTFSRKVEPQLKPLDLNKEIQHVVGILEYTIPKIIRIEVDLADDLLPVSGDVNQLEQILLNLASNAKDAMPQGGSLSIKSKNVFLNKEHSSLPSGEYVLLSVADTGAGMNEETLTHMYEPFYTTKPAGEGTGLGMSTVYGIVKNHGGTIDCVSQSGLGTTFSLYFPALSENTISDENADIQIENLEQGKETILVVDDEQAILETTQDILTQHGYNVFTSDNGKSALELYREKSGKIDLVILDLDMPGMRGEECLKGLMQLDSEALIIIASGYLKENQIATLMDDGAIDVIKKPYRIPDMIKRIQQVLKPS
jgi:two-component system cell cycle sensor histidine kinase/response regulator CckA